MSDDRPPSARVEQWVSVGATIIATVLSALLFYFGYVSSRSQYAYFGVDVDTIGLSTQEYIMRSPQPLLVPLLVLVLTGAGVRLLNTAVRGRITAVTADGPAASAGGDDIVDAPGHLVMTAERIGRIARWSRAAGQTVLTAGVVLLFIYPYVRDWSFYALATPLLIALGAAVTAYTSRVLVLLRCPPHPRAPAVVRDAGPLRAAPSSRPVMARPTMALVYVVVAACIFWATATIAQWSGRGLAQDEAAHLRRVAQRHPGQQGPAVPDRSERQGNGAARVGRADVPLSVPGPAPADPGPGPDVPRSAHVVGQRLDADRAAGRLGTSAVPVSEPATVTTPRMRAAGQAACSAGRAAREARLNRVWTRYGSASGPHSRRR